MCANFEAIRKNRAFLLDLPEPDQLDFPEDIFPNYPSPLIFSNDGNIEWRSVNFGMIPNGPRKRTSGSTPTILELKRSLRNLVLEMHGISLNLV